MKHPILAASITFALACGASVSVAQENTQTTTMQNVTVTGTRAPYETYVVDLNTGYGLQVLVGNTRRHYVEANHAAQALEAMRMQGVSVQPYISVAVDNSSGPGLARQIQLIDSARNTVAIVNVFCKGSVRPGESHCRLAPQSVPTHGSTERLASRLPVTAVGVGG